LKNSNIPWSKKLKILIAEDDFLVSEMIDGELIKAGYEVIAKADNGIKAVELTKSLKPDIVLMDIRMPEMNGLEASRHIMECCPTPIIILTAYDDRDMIIDAGDSGAAAYLNKPLDAMELEKAILISMARFKDIINLREQNKKLVEANNLNKQLMMEIHHRVKNNFQLISSLLNLQIINLGDNEAKKIIEAGRDRVQVLSILHEKLYEAENFVSLPMKLFVENLVTAICEAYITDPDEIILDIDIASIVLNSKKAVTIGLILNEVITNSIKYAFPNKVGINKISVSMFVEKKSIVMRVKDNGIGVADIEKIKEGNTLGMQLIFLLTESQLEGSIEVNFKEGLEVLIRFKP
jgi:two-component sensor histidine kinase